MRRRATPLDPNAPLPGQRPMFADDPAPIPAAPPRRDPPPPPAGFVPPINLEFVKCPNPSCGLKMSSGSLAKAGGKCMACETPIPQGSAAPDPSTPAPAEVPKTRRGRPTAAQIPAPDPTPTSPPVESPASVGVCGECFAPLTETSLGVFYPCGHDHRQSAQDHIPPSPKRPADTRQVYKKISDVEAPTVSVTWGEERYSPVQYTSYTVGPFQLSDRPHPGESAQQCFARLHDQLATMAASTRETKREAFLSNLRAEKAKG